MLKINNSRECCGCEACASICPTNAISMVLSKDAFYYPVINKEQCVDCGRCDSVCPMTTIDTKSKLPKAYIAQNKNDFVRMQSSSGGGVFPIGTVRFGTRRHSVWGCI